MRYAWLVLLAVGCYEAPDYSGTRFKCDDAHPCPSGQACVNGVCGGDSTTVDAPASEIGVACGDTTCAENQKCCADLLGGPSCVAQNSVCAGVSATCDGIEDCDGNPCCETNGVAACATTCAGNMICRQNADCTNPGQPACCMITGTGEPWGRCLAACP